MSRYDAPGFGTAKTCQSCRWMVWAKGDEVTECKRYQFYFQTGLESDYVCDSWNVTEYQCPHCKGKGTVDEAPTERA